MTHLTKKIKNTNIETETEPLELATEIKCLMSPDCS